VAGLQTGAFFFEVGFAWGDVKGASLKAGHDKGSRNY
jgi:hypothetical protein